MVPHAGAWMRIHVGNSSKSGKGSPQETQRHRERRWFALPGALGETTLRSAAGGRCSVSLCLCGGDPCLRRRERPRLPDWRCRVGNANRPRTPCNCLPQLIVCWRRPAGVGGPLAKPCPRRRRRCVCHRYVCPRPRRLGARRWVRSRGGEMIVTMNPLQLSATIDRGLAPTCWGRRTAGETMPEATPALRVSSLRLPAAPAPGSPVMAAKSGRRNDCDHEPLTTVCGAAVRRRMVVARLPLGGGWWIGRVRSAGDPSAGNGLDGAGPGGASGAGEAHGAADLTRGGRAKGEW